MISIEIVPTLLISLSTLQNTVESTQSESGGGAPLFSTNFLKTMYRRRGYGIFRSIDSWSRGYRHKQHQVILTYDRFLQKAAST